MALPPALKKILQALGINTVRLEWKLRYMRESWRWERTPFARWAKILSYRHKFCSCGVLVDKDAKVCPACGRKLHSRAAYRVSRLLGFVVPEIGVVWPIFMLVIVLVFVGQLRVGGLQSLLTPSNALIFRFGAVFGPAVSDGEYWRMLSAGLVHIGLIHILFNLMALSQLAPAIEDEIGAWKFIVLVTVTQLGTTLAAFLYHPGVLSAGASGIAFGLIGFGLAYGHREGTSRGRAMSDVYLKWAIYGFVFGMAVGADNAGHLGGLATGAALGWILPAKAKQDLGEGGLSPFLALVCLAAWGYTLFSMWRSIAAS